MRSPSRKGPDGIRRPRRLWRPRQKPAPRKRMFTTRDGMYYLRDDGTFHPANTLNETFKAVYELHIADMLGPPTRLLGLFR